VVALLRQLIQYSKDLSDTVRTERGREVDHECEELSFYFAALWRKDSISEGDCGSERGPMLTGRNAGSHVCVVECARKYQVITPGALSVLPKVPGALFRAMQRVIYHGFLGARLQARDGSQPYGQWLGRNVCGLLLQCGIDVRKWTVYSATPRFPGIN
jgi:hypothetical protein